MPKTMVVRVDVLTEPVAGECPACGFDALCRLHGYHAHLAGVSQIVDMIRCGRCTAEQQRTT